ncbi:MAG: hypothetical protein CVV51_13565 [Spirochaetae bacterium HGW-Spirochaetae-7]|nr:MAG: hypothetical protein CVV51_13565 [Spirochaetae bacterium HGW-Spirochaetae-7]
MPPSDTKRRSARSNTDARVKATHRAATTAAGTIASITVLSGLLTRPRRDNTTRIDARRAASAADPATAQ